MTLNGKVIQFWIMLFLCSCGPSSWTDLRFEGEAQTRRLTEELHAIENKEDLQKALPRLKKRFNKLADVLVEVRKYPKEEGNPSFISEQLFIELARIYEMPGGRELVESSQKQAVRKLGTF